MNQTVNVYNSLTFPDYNYHEIIAKKYGYEEILRSCFIVYCTFIDNFLQYFYLQGYGRGSVKIEEEDRHMNVNVSSSGQGTKTVILQIPKVDIIIISIISIISQ